MPEGKNIEHIHKTKIAILTKNRCIMFTNEDLVQTRYTRSEVRACFCLTQAFDMMAKVKM